MIDRMIVRCRLVWLATRRFLNCNVQLVTVFTLTGVEGYLHNIVGQSSLQCTSQGAFDVHAPLHTAPHDPDQHNRVTRYTLQFARLNDGSDEQFAIKFFLHDGDFEIEEALYWHTLIRPTLPDLIYSSKNAEGAVTSRSGVPFPPFMVLPTSHSCEYIAGSILCQGRTWSIALH